MKCPVRIDRLSLICFPMVIVLLCPVAFCQAAIDGQWVAFDRAGAPNSNLQCFTPRNVAVSNGYMVITTKAEDVSCTSFDLPTAKYKYTSGFVSMRTFNFLYGTVEFRAKFGGGSKTGAWPIVWMEDATCQASDPAGTDDRCNGQEIDIAEILNSDFTHVNQQIHVNDFKQNDGCTAPATDTSQNFHVYQLAWSAGSLIFKIDGTVTCTITKPYIPNSPMYVKANTFVGNYAGPVKDNSLPWTTLIDYVKVTQGSAVLFNDDFDLASTIRAAPFANSDAFPGPQPGTLRVTMSRLPWWSLALVLSVILIGVIVYRRMSVEK